MLFITHENKAIVKYPEPHDLHDEKYYTFIYKPQVRQGLTEYLLNDCIILGTANGYYFTCTRPGISAEAAPTFTAQSKAITTDGTALFKAVPYDFMLNFGDTLDNTNVNSPASAWKTDQSGVVISNSGFLEGITWCKVKLTSSELTKVVLTNHITVLRSSGKIETFDRSIEITVAPL